MQPNHWGTSLESGWWSYPWNSETVYTRSCQKNNCIGRLWKQLVTPKCTFLVQVATSSGCGNYHSSRRRRSGEVVLRANTVPLGRQRLGQTGAGPRRQLLMSSVNARVSRQGFPTMSKLLQESGELCCLFSRDLAKLADVWCLELCAVTLFVLLLKFGAVLSIIICGYEWLFDGSVLVGGMDCCVLLSCCLFWGC